MFKILILIFVSLASLDVQASEIRIDKEKSIFAVVTHRGGIASGLAHNHLVFAKSYAAHASYDERKSASAFEIRVATKDLDVDDFKVQQAWYPRLEALDVLDEPFTALPASDQRKIHETMLSKTQLNADKYPELTAKLKSIDSKETTVGSHLFEKQINLEVTIHGSTVQKTLPARMKFVGDKFEAEALGVFKFSEFGIEPFSFMMGAVRNQDPFHLYVFISGERK